MNITPALLRQRDRIRLAAYLIDRACQYENISPCKVPDENHRALAIDPSKEQGE